ncbi:MAG: amidohydrolase family protein, partial [Gemmatimonadaceae bacterium]|nr:amidohydrolase family protein [Gemmatimonadaceae bacterium]
MVRSRRVVLGGAVRPASVHLYGGCIARVSDWNDAPSGDATLDAGDAIIAPGLVDTHVHVNEPGRTAWEGFETATRAALAGGVTTIFDMPLNSIPATTSVVALEAKRTAARGRIASNVGLIGGVVPGNARDLAPLHARGVTLFKCFLVPSGVDEFPAVSVHDLEIALPILAGLGATLMVHAEDPALIAAAPHGGSRGYAAYESSRPPKSERRAIETVAALAERFGARVHIVH